MYNYNIFNDYILDQVYKLVLQAKSPAGTLSPLSIDKELTTADFALDALKVVQILNTVAVVKGCIYII